MLFCSLREKIDKFECENNFLELLIGKQAGMQFGNQFLLIQFYHKTGSDVWYGLVSITSAGQQTRIKLSEQRKFTVFFNRAWTGL